jgi:hypothetical protein
MTGLARQGILLKGRTRWSSRTSKAYEARREWELTKAAQKRWLDLQEQIAAIKKAGRRGGEIDFAAWARKKYDGQDDTPEDIAIAGGFPFDGLKRNLQRLQGIPTVLRNAAPVYPAYGLAKTTTLYRQAAGWRPDVNNAPTQSRPFGATPPNDWSALSAFIRGSNFLRNSTQPRTWQRFKVQLPRPTARKSISPGTANTNEGDKWQPSPIANSARSEWRPKIPLAIKPISFRTAIEITRDISVFDHTSLFVPLWLRTPFRVYIITVPLNNNSVTGISENQRR